MAALSNLKQCPPFSTLPDLALRHNHIPELERYPQINLNSELLANPAGQRYYGGQSFVSVNEGVLKRIARSFFNGGFWKTLEEARSPETREQAPLIAQAGDLIAQFLGLATGLRILPHTQQLSAERIAQFVETRWVGRSQLTNNT